MRDGFGPDTLRSWDEWLGLFERKMYPTFAKHGIGINAALIAFCVNRVDNELQYQTRLIKDDGDRPIPGDEWKEGGP